MIQRVQTLFLLAVVGLMSIMSASKMAYSPSEVINYSTIKPLFVLIIITLIIAFLSIFLYRKRVFQIRLSLFNTILLTALQGWVAYYFFIAPEGTAFSVTALFPAIAAISSLLALKFIARDEALVRSANSLRKKR